MKVVAAPLDFGFDDDPTVELEVVLYNRADRADRAGIGVHIPEVFRRLKLRPTNRAWDFLSLALAVQAVDVTASRDKSPDGWTRQLDLAVSVIDPDFWNGQTDLINRTLRFLTTDIWRVKFQSGGLKPPQPKKPNFPTEDCVSLLSGGLDSLIGAIDLTARDKKKPYLVSQVSQGDKKKQAYFASKIGLRHLQLNHVVSTPTPSERSQRARSLVFFAYGTLLGTSFLNYQTGKTVPLYVCENGLISINPSLTPMRLGSLSTRTTHPIYLAGVQEILSQAKMGIEIINPYQLKTKGEMLVGCADQALLAKLAAQSTSCGRFARNGFTHCGRCVPCVIRRASFHAWGKTDSTSYVYADLSKDDSDHSGFDDVRALCMASELASGKGFDAWIGASLTSTLIGNPQPYKDVVRRGMAELRQYLKASGVK
jgi:hypothetical protein